MIDLIEKEKRHKLHKFIRFGDMDKKFNRLIEKLLIFNHNLFIPYHEMPEKVFKAIEIFQNN
jgi:hypothetical protein